MDVSLRQERGERFRTSWIVRGIDEERSSTGEANVFEASTPLDRRQSLANCPLWHIEPCLAQAFQRSDGNDCIVDLVASFQPEINHTVIGSRSLQSDRLTWPGRGGRQCLDCDPLVRPDERRLPLVC